MRVSVESTSETFSEAREKSCYYEIVDDTRDQSCINQSSIKSRNYVWPPQKQIEDITYPTASPLYINPNPTFDRRSQQAIREKRASIEACERALSRRYERRSESIDREVERASRECTRWYEAMEEVNCPESMYRCVELVNTSRTSQSDVLTRPSSTDSVRRSLTPTKIVQPIPKPWTATVTNRGSNLYQQSYMQQEQPKMCKKFTQREICHRERMSGGKEQLYREEQQSFQATICRREQTICPKPPLPPKQEQPSAEMIKEVDIEVTDLRGDQVDESDVSSTAIRGEHDLITETAEETINGMHVKQVATFEKSMERASPERSNAPIIEKKDDAKFECLTKRTETRINRETESTMERTVGESTEVVTSAIDTQQMMDKVKQEEEEERKRQEEEERRKEEEEKERREAEERKRQEEEAKRKQEEEERAKKHVTFGEEEEVGEVLEQPLGRTVVREERITETDTTPGRCKVTKETYEEITEEVLVQERVRRKDIEDDERTRSLREQVEVHQSLRDQRVPERRVVSTYSQQPQQETMETCKKKIQLLKETETGPKAISDTPVKNSVPKEWKSEMVNALTTASDRPYTPLNATSSVKELYTEETIYLDHRCRPKPPPPKEEVRPISPFQQALTIAPERSYTPLNREIRTKDYQVASSSGTPSLQMQNGYCQPLNILYNDTKRDSYLQEEVCMKEVREFSGPRPLPTPPSDYRLRDSSASPARSRSETPGSKSITAGLKKPDAIPAYQKNLIAMKKRPVEDQSFVPSRTPTPKPHRSNSPAQGPPKPPACYMKVETARVREDPPPSKRGSVHFPSRKTISYHVDEDTDSGHRSQEYSASRSVNYDEKETNNLDGGPTDALHFQLQETRCMTSEETSEQPSTTSHVKKALQVVEDYEQCERKETLSALSQSEKDTCSFNKMSHAKPTLPCSTSRVCPALPKPTYNSFTDVRHTRYETPSSRSCSQTGITVLSCKAHSDQGGKAGVVSYESSQTTCPRSGVSVVSTKDRSGICVSPCFDTRTTTCDREFTCDYASNDCAESQICVTSYKKVDSTPTRSRTNLPFPQIPLPYEESTPPTSQRSPKFTPRTNLSGQLTQLIAKSGTSVPTIQLYKPQTQAQSQTQNYSTETYCQTQSYREPHCESGDHCRTQNRCQDQIHCPSSKTQSLVDPPNLSSHPDLGTGVGGLGGAGSSKSGSFAGSSAPKRGRGILNQAVGAGSRIPLCAHCNSYVRYSRTHDCPKSLIILSMPCNLFFLRFHRMCSFFLLSTNVFFLQSFIRALICVYSCFFLDVAFIVTMRKLLCFDCELFTRYIKIPKFQHYYRRLNHFFVVLHKL